MKLSSFFYVAAAVVATVAAPQDITCNTATNVASPGDCLGLISKYTNDQTIVIGDSAGRAVLTFSFCSIIIKFGADQTPATTRANLAARSQLLYDACDTGDNAPFSAALVGGSGGPNVYCLTSPLSVNECGVPG